MLFSRVITIIVGSVALNMPSTYTIAIFALIGFIIWIFVNAYTLNLIKITYKESILRTLAVFVVVSIIIAMPRILFVIIK